MYSAESSLIHSYSYFQEVRDTDLQVMSVKYGGTVEEGGWWTPTTCTPRRKVAIIIVYRNREVQLKIFLKHLHPILQRQQLFYRCVASRS